MAHESHIKQDSLYEVERQDLIDYESFPQDAEPNTHWGRDLPEGLTYHAALVIGFCVGAVVVVGCIVLLWIPEFSFNAQFASLFVAILANALFSLATEYHYRRRLSIDPRIRVAMMGDSRQACDLKATLAEGGEQLARIMLGVSVMGGLAVLLLSRFHSPTLWPDNSGILAAIYYTFMFALLPIIGVTYVLWRSKLRPQLVRKWPTVVGSVLSTYFQPDYAEEIPNRFRSPIGYFPVRILIFVLSLLFLTIGLEFQGTPAGLMFVTDKSWSDLVLAHPYHLSDEFEVDAPTRQRVDREFGENSLGDIFADEKRLPNDQQLHSATHQAATEQWNRVHEGRADWIWASVNLLRKRPFLVAGLWFTSLGLKLLLVVFCALGMTTSYLCDRILKTDWLARSVLEQRNLVADVSRCLKGSPDKYECESVFLGLIVEQEEEA